MAGESEIALSALNIQYGGTHYKDMKIQPVEIAVANNLGPLEFSVIKYAMRHKAKGKELDIKKAIHFLQLILRLLYGIESTVVFHDQQTDSSQLPAVEKS